MTHRLFAVALLIGLCPALTHAADFSLSLKDKRLVMRGCNYCGIEFVGSGTLIGYAEISGDIAVEEYRVRWIAKDIFLATQKGRNAKGCPPRNLLYKVERMSGRSVTLRAYWTGWPPSNDNIDDYRVLDSGGP